jgi:hypothetical protein
MNTRATIATETVVALVTAIGELSVLFKLPASDFKVIALDSSGVLKR